MLLVVLGTYLHGFGYGGKGKIPKVYFGHNIVGHCKWVWVHTIVFGFCTLDQTGSKLLQIIFSKLLSESYSRISHESLCLHHQSTLSCFVSLQLLLNCDHQVTSCWRVSSETSFFLCNKTISGHVMLLSNKVALLIGMTYHVFATLTKLIPWYTL